MCNICIIAYVKVFLKYINQWQKTHWFEYATELIVRHKILTAIAAELTEDIIGYTVKWARVLLSNQLWWIKAVSFILSSHLLFSFLMPSLHQFYPRLYQAISFLKSITGWLWMVY